MNKTLIPLITLLMIGFHCQGQKLPACDITTGFGYPETFHIGLKIHAFQKSKFGTYYGNGLSSSNQHSYNSLTIDHQYHYGKVSDLSNQQIWYFRQGLTFGIDNSQYSKIKYLFLNLSIGREFNVSSKSSLSVDLGLFKVLIENEATKIKKPYHEIKWKDFPAIPLIKLQINYSI